MVSKRRRYDVNATDTDGSFTTAISNLFFTPEQKNPIAADIIVFRIISGDFLFFYYAPVTIVRGH